MTQSNMPDVRYFYADMPDDRDGDYWSNTPDWHNSVQYTRHGAPSPWIDPKVMPIPDDLESDRLILCQFRALHGLPPCVFTVDEARIFVIDNTLLGYVILQE